MQAKFGRLIMCHMIADTREELDDMADRIGVARKWIQEPGTYREHYDVCLSKRALAVANGAKEISWLALSRIVVGRKVSLTREATP